MRFLALAIGVFAMSALCGCSGDSGSDSSSSSDGDNAALQSSESSSQLVRYSEPVKTVDQFLLALKNGDDKKVRAMLTVKAQEETAKHDMVIEPPGSATATFSVDPEFRLVGDKKQVAHVLSKWADVDDQNMPTEYEVAWILRYEHDGWGIAGVATEIFEDGMPLVLSFEKPVEMMQQRDWAESEMQRRAAAGVAGQNEGVIRQAQAPQGTSTR